MDPKLKGMITEHEGKRLDMYQDSKGIYTVGVGHNLEDKGISEAVCDLMLTEDIEEAIGDANTFRWFEDLNQPRQAVIIDMIFNLGLTRFSGFKRTIKFIENELYQSAAKEMLDSKWADQVGRRAIRLSEIMRMGEWDERALEWD
ncbi:MAG: lysozyme [Gammaproteobacteria bacterium]|nr:lysozyme [Gammaproteobacteria bacterium]